MIKKKKIKTLKKDFLANSYYLWNVDCQGNRKNRNHLLIIQLLIKNIYLCLLYGRPSLVAQSVKNLPVVQEIWV